MKEEEEEEEECGMMGSSSSPTLEILMWGTSSMKSRSGCGEEAGSLLAESDTSLVWASSRGLCGGREGGGGAGLLEEEEGGGGRRCEVRRARTRRGARDEEEEDRVRKGRRRVGTGRLMVEWSGVWEAEAEAEAGVLEKSLLAGLRESALADDWRRCEEDGRMVVYKAFGEANGWKVGCGREGGRAD